MTNERDRHIEARIRERLAAENVQIVSVQVRFAGKGTRVSVVLDTQSGITIEECARYNRCLRDELEKDFPDVSVEVASPGLDRLLKTEPDFQRVSGKAVKIIRLAAPGSPAELGGIVSEVGAGTVRITTPEGRDVTIPLDDIITAKQEIRWSHGK